MRQSTFDHILNPSASYEPESFYTMPRNVSRVCAGREEVGHRLHNNRLNFIHPPLTSSFAPHCFSFEAGAHSACQLPYLTSVHSITTLVCLGHFLYMRTQALEISAPMYIDKLST